MINLKRRRIALSLSRKQALRGVEPAVPDRRRHRLTLSWAVSQPPSLRQSAIDSPGTTPVRPLLCLIGFVVWPTAIALCRGYRRNRIGIGFDEPRAVMRAGLMVVVAGALPAGFIAVPLSPRDVLTLYALLKLIVTATPFAVLLSLIVRFLARKVQHIFHSHGAAQQLSERIQREPDAGMKVVGLCLPSSELPRQSWPEFQCSAA
jgi:hypothetical protein